MKKTYINGHIITDKKKRVKFDYMP